jgi:hypothetical protein
MQIEKDQKIKCGKEAGSPVNPSRNRYLLTSWPD